MATTCRDLPEMELNLKNSQEDVYKLLRIIKPAWKRDHIKIKTLSGGNSCYMLRCSEEKLGQSVTVRVRNNFECFIYPAQERLIVKAMSSRGYFPPLLAMFQNGFCYEYIPGRPVYMRGSSKIGIDEEQLRCIAQEMANIHSVAVPGFDYRRANIFEFIAGMICDVRPCYEGCPTKEELLQELRIVEAFVCTAQSPLVQIHADPHPGNIVWNQEQSKITFVDWEISQVAPRAYDIAYFINSFELFGNFMLISVIKPTGTERKFCVHYLKQANALCRKPNTTEDEIKQLLLEVKYFSLLVKLEWMIFFIRFQDIMSAVGNMERIWQFNYNNYITTKEEVLGIKILGQPKTKPEILKRNI